MGVSLNQVAEGAVGWYSTVDGNWTTLESQFLARDKADASVVTVSSTTAETLLMNNTTIPANALAVGTVIPVWAAGSITIPATSTPSVTWRLRWGGLTGVQLGSFTWNFSTNPAAYTQGWVLDYKIVGDATGTSGNAVVTGWMGLINVFGAHDEGATTIDTTTAKSLVWTIQSTVAGVSTSMRMMITDIG